MSLFTLCSLFIAPLLAVAQNLNPTIICVPGQCLQGYSNTTLGARLSSSSSSPVPLHILPGQYSSTTNPQLLHDALTSSSTTLSASAGFSNASFSLPLDLTLEPGLAVFTERLYSGQTSFIPPPDSSPDLNTSTPISAKSLTLSSDVVVIAMASSNRVVLWDSIPDTEQLPSSLSSTQLGLVDIQITTCAPTCSSAGICGSDGKCSCLDGFTGNSCEICSPGHFGPNCQKCEDGCDECDEGISGTGRCIKRSGGGNTCNCLNGVCGNNGECACNSGFVKADNGTQCAKCADGFFETTTGDCKACTVGCDQCASGTGVCLQCRSGWTQDNNDRTICHPPKQLRSNGGECPEISFATGDTCTQCAQPCQSCSGSSSNDCTACVQGQYMLNGVCVRANGDGVCEGTNLIADNNKKACDSCGAKCTSCKIPNFSIASLATELQCTGCIPGTFLLEGKCLDTCPDGTFVSQDGSSCLPCDSSCSTCTGSSTFCLSCSTSGQLSTNGRCVAASSCPSKTFASPSSSSCLSCHPDCESCTGSRFNECTSCPPFRPVLNNGRCMPTCSKNEYWDNGSNSCRACDSSCGSCSGSGSSNCLSCSSSNDHLLRSGSCIPSSDICSNSDSKTNGNGNGDIIGVIGSLGVCLSELVTIPKPSETSSDLPPLPTVSGIDQPTVVINTGKRLEWWQILLMALGCAFIFMMFIWCCRRRMRRKKDEKKRKMGMYAFAEHNSSSSSSKNKSKWCWGRRKDSKGSISITSTRKQQYHPDLHGYEDEEDVEVIHTMKDKKKKKSDWRWKLVRFGEKFFGHQKSTRVYPGSGSGPMVRGKSIQIVHSNLSHSRSNDDIKLSNLATTRKDERERDIDLEQGYRLPTHSSSRSHSRSRSRSSSRSRSYSPPTRIPLPNTNTNTNTKKDTKRISEDEVERETEDLIQLISSYTYSVNPKTPPATKKNFMHHGSRYSHLNHPLPSSRNSNSNSNTNVNGLKVNTKRGNNNSRTQLLDDDEYEDDDNDECYHRDNHRNEERSRGRGNSRRRSLESRESYDYDYDYEPQPQPRHKPKPQHNKYEYEHRETRDSISTDSLYSQMTGYNRRLPQVRQPIRDGLGGSNLDIGIGNSDPVLKSKFSMSTIATQDLLGGKGGNGKGKLKKKGVTSSFWK